MGIKERFGVKPASVPPTSADILPPQVSQWAPPIGLSPCYNYGPNPQPANEQTVYVPHQPVIVEEESPYEPPISPWSPAIPPTAGSTNDPKPNFAITTELGAVNESAEDLQSIQPPVANNPSYQDKTANHGYIPLKNTDEHEGSISLNEIAPPVDEVVKGSASNAIYDVDKPVCSLNIVCFRSGQEGCNFQQLQCILSSRCPDSYFYTQAMNTNPSYICNDPLFFRELRRLYEKKMCTFFRRHFSLKTHQGFRILSYTRSTRPEVVPFDGFILQEMMYAYRNPDESILTTDWVEWVFRLRRKDRRHAIEFVEGWDSTRITIAGSIPWLASCLIAIIWTAAGGDPQTTFTVASFILTSSSIILALLAIVSSLEPFGGSQ